MRTEVTVAIPEIGILKPRHHNDVNEAAQTYAGLALNAFLLKAHAAIEIYRGVIIRIDAQLYSQELGSVVCRFQGLNDQLSPYSLTSPARDYAHSERSKTPSS
ncbi:hypothetical protein GCM10016234_34320 [Tianweitania populi]|uniref:Uncharacterized protein n=1 Tax=Tianweitania populi TaxID=1607949 RepID=A0A8J3GM66_9HYPH|nr:hypothetical protein [Tianweitania populi]GHD21053.1 hypothetical protein GCM10016234_34320 [Tianweitania populi]